SRLPIVRIIYAAFRAVQCSVWWVLLGGLSGRAHAGGPLAVGGLPIRRGKREAPKQRRWFCEFRANFSLVAFFQSDKSYRGRQFFRGLGVHDGNFLATHHGLTPPDHEAVRAHRYRGRFLFEGLVAA